MADYIGPLTGGLDKFVRIIAQKYCPLCGNNGWEPPLLTCEPLVRGEEAHFVADEPYTKNNVLISAVFVCQVCRYEIRFRAGELPAIS